MPIAAITGATGYIGRFVAAELHRLGFDLRALARPDSDRSGFQVPIEWLIGDMQTASALDQLVAGASAVVHLAYTHVPGRYRGGEGDNLPGWLAANLYGSLALIQAAQQAGVERFIFLSSRAVFSRTEPGRDLDESHPPTPDTHYGAYKVAVEAFLNSTAALSAMRTFSVRATGVYGLTWPPARSKWWPIIQAVRQATAVDMFTAGGTEVYGGDVARLIGLLLTDPTLRPIAGVDIVHLSDLVVTGRDVVQIARQISGRAGTLPAEPATIPANPLVCRRIAELGFTLGGRSALEAAIAELIAAVH